MLPVRARAQVCTLRRADGLAAALPGSSPSPWLAARRRLPVSLHGFRHGACSQAAVASFSSLLRRSAASRSGQIAFVARAGHARLPSLAINPFSFCEVRASLVTHHARASLTASLQFDGCIHPVPGCATHRWLSPGVLISGLDVSDRAFDSRVRTIMIVHRTYIQTTAPRYTHGHIIRGSDESPVLWRSTWSDQLLPGPGPSCRSARSAGHHHHQMMCPVLSHLDAERAEDAEDEQSRAAGRSWRTYVRI